MLFPKKWAVCAAICTVLISVSCNKDRDTGPAFDMRYQHDFTLPAGIGPLVAHHFYIKDVPTRYQQLLTQAGKSDGDVFEIITSSASLDGIFGDADFGLVERASLRVYEGSDPTDYQEVGYREPVPLNVGNSLGLIPTLENVEGVMKGSRFSMDLVVWLRATTQQETETRLTLNFKARY